MRRLIHLPLYASLAVLAACGTVGPDYRVPEEAAIQRPAAAAPFASADEPALRGEPLPPHWWRLYRDASLDALVGKAFAANTDLRVAAANLARARAVQQEAAGAADPVIGATGAPAYGRASAAAKGLPQPLADGYSHDAGISVSYQLDLFGKIRRGVEAAGADSAAAEAALDLARVTVAADTARAYVDACGARHQLDVARRSVELQQRFVEMTGRRIRAGRGTALDEARARAQLEQLRAAIPPLLAQGRTARFRLAALTGRAPAEMADSEIACTAVPRLAQPVPVGDGAALLRRRPDLRGAERSLAAATARIGVATSELYPSVSLGLSAGSSGALDRLGAGNALRWSLGPLVSWTLPTRAGHARVAEAESATAAALARFDGLVLNALRETETAMTVYARELDRNAALRAAQEQSALAARQSHRLYEAGKIDFLAVLDADRTLAAGDSALAASDAQVAADQVALFLALGGGWEQPGG
ncbi:efflux transporter outer membrane subunit [Pseudoduganella albidiflava]|uniref:Efflux transporter outer membrane subunit n=1 Tax=Pseudoduganella albidiflava TaxID=321983 RepID=A0A411X016_9BURK|nr:efflux transporter outer membrane subunit [Pseudoduganella albidiflava]QBI02283.1 efflux transporter outer membrane subunit [Pseudoduganella albidiflava]GGY67302.1 outer membrane efflux protein [Pseudoduganella albidiflava]